MAATDEFHPRATLSLLGHADAEATLLDAYRGGRIAHAWLLGGEHGIGKATLAYRMVRFVLAHPDPAAPAVQDARSLAVPTDHPVRFCAQLRASGRNDRTHIVKSGVTLSSACSWPGASQSCVPGKRSNDSRPMRTRACPQRTTLTSNSSW
jgi:hypothetical protein